MTDTDLRRRFTDRRAARRSKSTLKASGSEHRRELGERYASPSSRGSEEGADLFDPIDDEDDE